MGGGGRRGAACVYLLPYLLASPLGEEWRRVRRTGGRAKARVEVTPGGRAKARVEVRAGGRVLGRVMRPAMAGTENG